MNGIGYKIKKTILYILLILLSVVCMFPFLFPLSPSSRWGSLVVCCYVIIPRAGMQLFYASAFSKSSLLLLPFSISHLSAIRSPPGKR